MTGAAKAGAAVSGEALDVLPTAAVVGRLLTAAERVLPAVRAAVPAIARAAVLNLLTGLAPDRAGELAATHPTLRVAIAAGTGAAA